MMRRLIYALMLGSALLSACANPAATSAPDAPTPRATAHVMSSATPALAAAAVSATQAVRITPTPVGTLAPEPSPTSEPAPEETQQSGAQSNNVIVVDQPRPDAVVKSPMVVTGSTNFWPFEATLGGTLKDASGNVVAQFPVTVQSPDAGQGGPFKEEIAFTAPAAAQEGTLEIFDSSAKDGSILSVTRVKVRLEPGTQPAASPSITQPDDNAVVTMPLHVVLAGLRGDERVALRLLQHDAAVATLQARAELGYVVATLTGAAQPGAATLEVARPDGSVVARRAVRIVAPEETQIVKVAWKTPGAETITLEERRVPRTPQVGTAALNELLWGPDPGAHFETALPAPSEVLGFSGRAEGWAPRVRLIKLTITDGVAVANFGPELRAYGGGSARVAMIRQQIEATLRQFPSVKQVEIAIEGRTEGVLEP